MKFLIDNALSFRVAEGLSQAGYDAVHVTAFGLGSAMDEAIFELAGQEDRVIVSVDTDFGTLLAQMQTNKPSFILFRWPSLRVATQQVEVILANLDNITEHLASGAVVVIEPSRVRIRVLPIGRS